MFYEEISIRDILNCEKCNQRLTEPKTLPCTSNICLKCIESIQILNNEFDCPICSKQHTKPVEGFPTNKTLLALLAIKPTKIHSSDAVQSFKSSLTDLLNRMDKLSANVDTNQIRTLFEGSKEQVYSATRILLDRIEEFYIQFTNKIDECESECLKLNQNQKELKETIDAIIELHNEWSEYLKKHQFIIDKSNSITDTKKEEQNKSQICEQEIQELKVEDAKSLGFFVSQTLSILQLSLPQYSMIRSINSSNAYNLASSILYTEQIVYLMNLCSFSLEQEWQLVYRATSDGFAAEDFHSKCNDKENTLILIQSSSGNIFGGYTEQNWSGDGYKKDPNAFIYSLINKENVSLILRTQNPESAIYVKQGYGPTFGKFDLCIRNNSNLNFLSSSELGNSYAHPNYYYGSEQINSFLAGVGFFQTSEIEVFSKV